MLGREEGCEGVGRVGGWVGFDGFVVGREVSVDVRRKS